MAVIEGGCEKLAVSTASAPEEREEYAEILLAARRLRRLVKNLLDVSRLESGALKPKLDWCDLGPVESCAYRMAGVDPSREMDWKKYLLSLIHIPEPTRLRRTSFPVLCSKKKNVFHLLH